MNKTYRNVWNAATNTWTAAAETAKGRTKGSARAARSVLVALALAGAGIATMPGANASMFYVNDGNDGGCGRYNEGTVAGGAYANCNIDSVTKMVEDGAPNKGGSMVLNSNGLFLNNKMEVNGTLSLTGNKLLNVANGTADTDGVNLGQMKGALSTKVDDTLFKANGTTAATIGTGGATAVAIGNNAKVGDFLWGSTPTGAVAIGNDAYAESGNAATGNSSVAIGGSASAMRAGSVALGSGAKASTVNATDNYGVSIGTGTVSANAGTAIGYLANASGNYSTALGERANTNVDAAYATAVGAEASVRGYRDDPTTPTVTHTANNSMAMGRNASVAANATGNADNSMAFGYGAKVSASNDTGSNSVAMGTNASVDQANSLALGTGATVASNAANMARNSVAIGNGAAVKASATANADNAVALGNAASVTGASFGAALGAGASVTANNAVALGSNSVADVANTISVGSSTVKRKIVNMDAGTVAAGSTDAVNGGQLYTASNSVAAALGGGSTVNPDGSISMPTYTVGDGKGGTVPVSGVGGVVTNLDNRVSTNEGAISDIRDDLASGSLGLVQQAAAGANLTVGKDTDGAAVDFKGTTGARKLINVADGAVAAGSLEAVNGGQLHGVSSSVADAIGGGSTVNADGSISKPTFTVGDGAGGTKDVHTVGDVVSNLDGRVTGNEKAIGDIRSELGSGTVGLVQQNATSRNITVAAGTDGTVVDFTNNASAARTLTGVADGKLDPTSKEAVNGSQLDATNQNVAKNASDITTLNTNVTNLDGRVTTAEGNITTITDKVSKLESGGVGLVQQATPTGDITVAAGTGGTVVNFAGSAGERRLTGVANGVSDTDAVTIAQLKATGLIDYTGKELGALVYDDLTLGMATLGGVGGTVINNLAPGLIAFGSMQAVNGGQLFDMQQDFNDKIGKLDDRVGKIESGIEDGSIGGPGTGTPEGSVPSPGKGEGSTAVGAGSSADGKNSSAIGAGASASKEGSTAVGAGSSASGDKSTAIGAGAQASNNNSVAIGEGSKTTRDNEVSFGSPGNERILGNVAEGKLGTDAVNVNQLNREIGGLRNEIDSNRRDAAGGTATAVALANLPSAALPGDSVMSLAAGTYEGESAMAIGVSTATKDGKWLLKASGSTNTRGSAAVGAGVGFRW